VKDNGFPSRWPPPGREFFLLPVNIYYSLTDLPKKFWVTDMSARRHTAPPVAQMRGFMFLL